MEEALKSFQIVPKVLAKRSNVIWDILLVNVEEAKRLARSVLTTKTVRLQTEYMGTRCTKITLHGFSMDITEERLGAFFSQFGQVAAVAGETGIATRDCVLQVTTRIFHKPRIF